MRRWSRAGAIAVAALLLAPAAAAAPAPAGGAPECWVAEIWARPGKGRAHEMTCVFADAAELVTPPAHGSLSDLRFADDTVSWTYYARPDAPEEDGFELRLAGPGGTAVQRVDVHIVPLTRNTAPSCAPVEASERSPGTASVFMSFVVHCRDAEHDAFEVHGSGPGDYNNSNPRHVDGGHSEQGPQRWWYWTVAHAGTEETTVWAIDEFGARSATTPVSLRVGPAVEPAPWCQTSLNRITIPMRPHRPRTFWVTCSGGGDRFEVRLGEPPEHGTLARFAPDPLETNVRGTAIWTEITYVPDPGQLREDRFSIIAQDGSGARTETVIEMVPRAMGNQGPDCWFAENGYRQAYFEELLYCSDMDGPITASILRPPLHGVVRPPLVERGYASVTNVWIDYHPDRDFDGIDWVVVRATDDLGASTNYRIPFRVRQWRPPPALPPPPAPPAPDRATAAQPTAATPAALAQEALGARRVKLVRRVPHAQVYAARRTLRRGARGGRRVLAVTCSRKCRLRARTGRRRQRRVAEPGRAAALRLARRIARRRAGRRVAFRLRVGSARATVRLPVDRAARKKARRRSA